MGETLFMDSCGDHYDLDGLLLKWRAFTIAGLTAAITNSGRTGKGIILGQLGGLSSGLTRNVKAQSSTLVTGVALKYGSLGGPNGSKIWSHGNLVGNGYTSCSFNLAGVPTIYGPSGEILAVDESGFFVHPEVWYYVELVTRISWTTVAGTGGSPDTYKLVLTECSMYVDGRLACTKTAYTTSLVLAAEYPMGTITVGGVGTDTTIDDVYCTDGSRWGNAHIRVRRANADGNWNDFTPDSGSSHYDRVSDTVPDTTSYLESSTVGAKESHNVEDITSSIAEIKGVQHVLMLKQDVEGVRAVNTLVRQAGADFVVAAPTHYVNLSYLYYLTPLENNPVTDLPWTKAEFNAAEFGLEISI